MRVPNDRSYWVEPGRFLAGAYPGSPDPVKETERIRAFLDCGIRTFVNLMFEDELDKDGNLFRDYEPIVEREAKSMTAQCHRFPIVDVSTPTHELMDEIQAVIRESLRRNDPVYVHCWGGRGRTGQVAGVYLIDNGFASVDDFVEVIARRRSTDAGGEKSPETDEQVAFVRNHVLGSAAGSRGL